MQSQRLTFLGSQISVIAANSSLLLFHVAFDHFWSLDISGSGKKGLRFLEGWLCFLKVLLGSLRKNLMLKSVDFGLKPLFLSYEL